MKQLYFLIIIFIFFVLANYEGVTPKIITTKPSLVSLNSPYEITPLKTHKVKPVVYTHAASLENLPTDKKKQAFISMLLPSILLAKEFLFETQKIVKKLERQLFLTKKEREFLHKLHQEYKTTNIKELHKRLQTHPVSIVLAQAAVESGWGGSRFFLEANNIFGVWSFNKNEPRIPALGLRGDKQIFVKKYKSLEESVEDYFKTLARSAYFKGFRDKRMQSKDPLELVWYLKNYSELRDIYVERIISVIEKNNLTKYDEYVLQKTTKEKPKLLIRTRKK